MSPAADNRTERLIVRMTADEKEMLRELAEGEGLTASDFVRQFIRRAHAERPAVKPAKRPKR